MNNLPLTNIVIKCSLMVGLTLSLSACPAPPKHPTTYVHSLEQPQILNENALRLLNWNIYKKVEDPHWQKELAELITLFDPNILTLQEVNLSKALPSVHPDFGYVFAPNMQLDEAQFSGVATAAQSSPLSQNALLSTVTEPLMHTPKVALLTQYELSPSKQRLLIANLHAINFVKADKFAVQLAQLKQWLLRHRGPMIVAGDFNTWDQNRVEQLQLLAAQLKLTPVHFEADERTAFRGYPLDHIYHSQDLSPYFSWVSTLANSSDHQPMMVAFAFAQNSTTAQTE